MDACESNLSEVEQRKLQIESLKQYAAAQEEKQRAAVIAAESFLTFLRHLYGYDL